MTGAAICRLEGALPPRHLARLVEKRLSLTFATHGARGRDEMTKLGGSASGDPR